MLIINLLIWVIKPRDRKTVDDRATQLSKDLKNMVLNF